MCAKITEFQCKLALTKQTLVGPANLGLMPEIINSGLFCRAVHVPEGWPGSEYTIERTENLM